MARSHSQANREKNQVKIRVRGVKRQSLDVNSLLAKFENLLTVLLKEHGKWRITISILKFF